MISYFLIAPYLFLHAFLVFTVLQFFTGIEDNNGRSQTYRLFFRACISLLVAFFGSAFIKVGEILSKEEHESKDETSKSYSEAVVDCSDKKTLPIYAI